MTIKDETSQMFDRDLPDISLPPKQRGGSAAAALEDSRARAETINVPAAAS
jgi:hypothetical protein